MEEGKWQLTVEILKIEWNVRKTIYIFFTMYNPSGNLWFFSIIILCWSAFCRTFYTSFSVSFSLYNEISVVTDLTRYTQFSNITFSWLTRQIIWIEKKLVTCSSIDKTGSNWDLKYFFNAWVVKGFYFSSYFMVITKISIFSKILSSREITFIKKCKLRKSLADLGTRWEGS